MRLKSKVSNPNSFISASGDKVHTLFSPVILPDGSLKLKKSGSVNIQDEINSHRDETDMSFILNRLKLGDSSVINKDNPIYGDFLNAPSSMAEAMQIAIDGEKAFNSLPVSVRAQFDFNFRKWIISAGSDNWFSAMSDFIKKPESFVESVVESEVIKNES